MILVKGDRKFSELSTLQKHKMKSMFRYVLNILIFGTRNTNISFSCSTKCSESKYCKVPQTLRDYVTEK